MLPGIIRTVVPIIVGLLIGLPIVKALGLTDAQVAMAVTSAITALYYVVARFIEKKYPKAGVLLGYPAKPVYGAPVPLVEKGNVTV